MGSCKLTKHIDVDQLSSLRDMLRWAVSNFNQAGLVFGHGSASAWDEAVYLLLHSLHLPLDTLEPFLDARMLASERASYAQLIRTRISTRKPAAYLTGEAWLQGLRFLVDERVIIPRSPIAELLAEQLHPWIDDPGSINRVLDLCTGSGCLAVLAALSFPNASVDAIDLSTAALEPARQNIALHDLQARVHTVHSDLFQQLPEATVYDLIICNPPYVNAQAMATLPPEYRHEPAMALAGGVTGMDLVGQILQQARQYLSTDGLLVLEIGHEQANFEACFPTLEPLWLSTATSSNQIMLLRAEQLPQ